MDFFADEAGLRGPGLRGLFRGRRRHSNGIRFKCENKDFATESLQQDCSDGRDRARTEKLFETTDNENYDNLPFI